jgi:hypothetical protein
MLKHKESKIHGYGLFTTETIPKGEIIGEFKVVPATYQTKFSIWIDDIMFRATNILKYSNHSSIPTARMEYPYLIADVDIKPHMEITWYYGDEF